MAAPDLPLQHEVAQFLYHEANLLDRGDLAAWEALFAEGGTYWMPLAHDQADPFDHASIFYEDAVLREVRRRRLEQRNAWSQQPVTRSARIVGNVRIEGEDANGGLIVRSTFQMTEWRKRREHRQLAGHYRHDLVRVADALRIRQKRIDLIDCDAVHDCFEIFV